MEIIREVREYDPNDSVLDDLVELEKQKRLTQDEPIIAIARDTLQGYPQVLQASRSRNLDVRVYPFSLREA